MNILQVDSNVAVPSTVSFTTDKDPSLKKILMRTVPLLRIKSAFMADIKLSC